MTEFIGQSGNHVLFADAEKEHGVIVDSRVSLVVASGDYSSMIEAQEWGAGEFSATDLEIAGTVIASLEHPAPEPTGRKYTIPRAVQQNARVALQNDDGESPIAQYIGTLLAAGGQVSFNELANINEFFAEREEEDSTMWRLYGGLPSKKWAASIVEREALTASAPKAPEDLAQLLADNPEAGPEFLVRLSTQTGMMDRLYRIDLDKRTYVWDHTTWNDLGQTDWDIWDYDFALDGKQSNIDQTHIMIDPESAISAAAMIASGVTKFTVDDIAPLETTLALEALADEDWDLIDSITAATVPGGADGDGIYSEDERSANASRQVRDGRGQFAKMGSRVMINGNARQAGLISRVIPANGTVEVTLDGGQKVVVPGNQVEATTETGPAPGTPIVAPEIDFTGILAKPRQPIDRTIAQLTAKLPQLARKELKAVLDNFPAWVKNQRDNFKPDREAPSAGTKSRADSTRTTTYDHPLLNIEMTKAKRAVTAAAPVPTPPTAQKPVEVDPDTSDVQPVYMAIVSPDDPRAVFKLISLVPANSQSNQPMVYSREEGEWKRDDATLNDLKSATPPPVVALDESTLDDVLVQVDGSQGVAEEAPIAAEPVSVPVEPDPGSVTASALAEDLALMVLWGPNKSIMEQALVAAGGADRNRGGAEKLRKYWTLGEGGLKIRWNTNGDWTRCVRYLTKHLGARAKGYCALRHKEMTGKWTGDKEHVQKFSANTPITTDSTDFIFDTETIVAAAFKDAQFATLRERLGALTASAGEELREKYQVFSDDRDGLVAAAQVIPKISAVGGAFLIPLVIPEELESGDGREVDRYALDMRNLPLPLMWQIQTGEGHNGAVVVGRIERMGRTPQGIGMAYGHFDVGPYGREAERMVRAGMLRHVSADMDKFEAEAEEAAEKPGKISKSKLAIKKARVMGVTIVAKPAFQECTIVMAPERALTMEDEVLPDGIITEEADPMDAMALVAAGYIADAIPVVPPRAWFDNPDLKRATPLTVDDDGRVFGHVAAWGTAHMNPALNGVNPPRSASGYAFFNKGVLRTDDGTDVTVGQLTLVGGHADLHFSARDAVKHYDDTASAFADVHAGEDQYGIWVAGALRPGVSAEQVRAIRASTPSGDWRPIRGKLELIAVCQVNVPGFPIARAMVASGHTMALVAAGASELAHLRPDPILDLARRVQELENNRGVSGAELAAKVTEHLSDMTISVTPDADLAAKSAEIVKRMETFGYVSKKSRDAAADKGHALPDGAYPIRNVEDLKNAIKAYGRAKESERAKVRRHIMKRARALGKADLIPDEWKHAASAAITASVMSMRERVEAARSETALVASVEDDLKKLTPAQRQRLINDLKAKGEEIPEELAPKAQGGDPDGDRPKYKPGYQPRDYNGQFKQVLARLKEDLGDDSNSQIAESIEAMGKGGGDYAESVRAGLALKSHLDRLDSKALNPEAIQNVRAASRDLGKAISNLPLPFENQAAKLRFSDVPPTLRDLMQDLVKRVHEKIGNAEGQKATQKLRSFMSGGDMFSQSEISREMSRFLRLLT